MIARLLGTKLAAATLTTVLLAAGAAAATGTLPDSMQDLMSDAADNVGIDLPEGNVEVPEIMPVSDSDGTDDGMETTTDDGGEIVDGEDPGDLDDVPVDDGVGGDDTAGTPETIEIVNDEESGAEHGMYKGSPTSEAGQAAHEDRDEHLAGVAARQAGHQANPAEEKVTPASEQGVEAHATRDARQAELDQARADRAAEKAARPAEGDEAEGDDDADEADEDEDGKDKDESDDADEDDSAGDEAPAV